MADKILSVSVDTTAAQTVTLVAAVTGKKIQVTGFCLSVENGALGVKSVLRDITGSVVRFTLKSGGATALIVYETAAPEAAQSLFETAVGSGLELVAGTAALVAGIVNYRYV